ncbi:hypothetical protein QUF70_11090 [Desulfobacterales bacterium HSG17]|nr:hypothetical protein [Desulfobacterales bacterium HSG17]
MKYTCAEYREEMMLIGLRKQLNQEGISDEKKKKLIKQIKKLESEMDMD